MVISRAFKNAHLLKSLTGLTAQAFNQLLIRFEQACLAMQASQKRKRALGAYTPIKICKSKKSANLFEEGE